jgi:hypothetical protein
MPRLQHAKQELPRRLKGINWRVGANRAQAGEYLCGGFGQKSAPRPNPAAGTRAQVAGEVGSRRLPRAALGTTLITRYFLHGGAEILPFVVAVER